MFISALGQHAWQTNRAHFRKSVLRDVTSTCRVASWRGQQEELCLAAPPASDGGWFPCCAFLRRSPSRAKHCSLFPSDFCGIENFSTACQPQEPPWSPTGVGVSSTCFLHSSSELTQQDTPGWRSIYRLPSYIVKKTQGFPSPCKLVYLLGHYFKTSITRSLVFVFQCEGTFFKESISIQIFLVLIDHFPSCSDLPGMGRALLI